MVCAMGSFDNVDKGYIEEWLQNYACELSFQYMTDTAGAAMEEKRDIEGGEDESEESKGQSTKCMSPHQSYH